VISTVLANSFCPSEYDRARLRQGLIKSNFLPGPFAGFTGYISPSLLCSQVQTSQHLSRLLTLPNEILKMILSYLDPIWLFQAEAACPQIRALSTSLNSIWYEIMPPALFAEPEHFQDEERLAARPSEQDSSSLYLATSDVRFVLAASSCIARC
jgi:F-box-like